MRDKRCPLFKGKLGSVTIPSNYEEVVAGLPSSDRIYFLALCVPFYKNVGSPDSK
jgi:hypothetical protein